MGILQIAWWIVGHCIVSCLTLGANDIEHKVIEHFEVWLADGQEVSTIGKINRFIDFTP